MRDMEWVPDMTQRPTRWIQYTRIFASFTFVEIILTVQKLHQKQSQPSGSNVFPAQVSYVPLGIDTNEFRIAELDTGTVRHGLEKTTYAVRVKDTIVI